MAKIILYDGRLFSPHYIIVKGLDEIDDISTLKLFNIPDPELVDKKEEEYEDTGQEIFVVRSGEWTCLIDNWEYLLWHSDIIKESLIRISKELDLFQSSIGDSDNSYDFRYFENGLLVREFVYDHNQSVIKKDFGNPLKNEREFQKLGTIEKIVIEAAKSVGIKTEHDLDEVNIYRTSMKHKYSLI